MTDDSQTVHPSTGDGGFGDETHYQSSASARDDDLADSIGIDGIVDQHEVEASGLPTASSPEPRPVRQSRRHEPQLPPPYVSADSPAPGAVGRGHDRVDEEARKIDERSRKRRKAPWWELPVLVLVAIVIAVLVKTFVVQPFYIPSQSMEKTLHGCPGCKGDRILVNKPIYDLRDPHPGDIVVFDAPPGWNDEIAPTPPSNPVLKAIRGFGQLVGVIPPDGLVLVKRVIAVGGQTVKGDAAGHVMISDTGLTGPWRTLDEHTYVYRDRPDSHAEFGPVTVPKGRLWVMGDHRNDSADSRFHCGPGGVDGATDKTCDATSATVPVNDVIGKAVVIAWPPSRWRTLGTPKTFTQSAAATASALGAELEPMLPMAGSALLVGPAYLMRRRRRRP